MKKRIFFPVLIIVIILAIPLLHFLEPRIPIGEQNAEIPWVFKDKRLDRKANLSLPVDINTLSDRAAIGLWGLHGGNHPEGFDHIGFGFKEKAPIFASDYGLVAVVENRGDDDNKIIIFHNYTIVTWYDHITNVQVEEGQEVEKGQIIGYSYGEGGGYIDWAVIDYNNDTGPLFTRYYEYKNGSFVPPYYYLNEHDAKVAYDLYNKTLLQPWLNGEFFGPAVINKAEYKPVNPVFPPRDNDSDIAGVWISTDYWKPEGYPEVLVFIHANTEYFGPVNYFVYSDVKEELIHYETEEGNYTVDYSTKPFRIKLEFSPWSQHSVLYGIFEIDNSGSRPKLKIEFSDEDYPSQFSSNAKIYIIRSRLHPIMEAKIESLSMKINSFSIKEHSSIETKTMLEYLAELLIAVDILEKDVIILVQKLLPFCV